MARPRPPDRLARILDAAMRVFARRGFDAVKMSDVAAAAGVSQGTLYNYVESKEALFRLLLDRGLSTNVEGPTSFPVPTPTKESLAQRMEDAVGSTFSLPKLDAAVARRSIASLDPRAELFAVVEELFDQTYRTREAADVLEKSAREVPELALVFYGKIRRGLLERIERLIAMRSADGIYRELDPVVTARFVLEAVTMFARHVFHDPEPPKFQVETAKRVITEILVHGMVARRSPRASLRSSAGRRKKKRVTRGRTAR
jgi:AcrR family transcriptional regulator